LLPEESVTRAENKASRLLEIEALLLAHLEGMSQAELARRLDVNRSTILRNLADVPNIYEETDGRLRIDRAAYLVNVRLNLDEALALHLATRLLATRLDRQNPHAAAALRKLGISMETLAPRISRHMLQSADVMDDSLFQRQDPVYLAALERLTLAWAELRKVQVWHRHDDDNVYQYTFAPYFIEPYAVGQTTHVIGLRQPPGEVRTFKVERLERVELLHEAYEIPPDFDPRAFLRSAWGIWFTEGKPVRVVLQFSGRVARRVKETRWHPSQELQDLPGGGLRWQAEIAEPREMLPWIRGWGADVEVLEPEEMREVMKDEARRLYKIYDQEPATPPDPILERLLRCWGKTVEAEPDPNKFHPVVFHMLDVGNVARKLLADPASLRWRRVLGRVLNADESQLQNWLPWLVAMHDIGKISAAFQRENSIQAARMKLEGFNFSASANLDHTLIGQAFIAREFSDIGDVLPESYKVIWRDQVGGHHGQFSSPGRLQETFAKLQRGEPAEWIELRKTAVALLKKELAPKIPKNMTEPENISSAIMALTGFTILCDWLGSDSTYFKQEAGTTFIEYAVLSANRAHSAVKTAGFFEECVSHSPVEFSKLFANLRSIRPLQAAIDAIPEANLVEPCLAIIEAPTGEGKTEAALALAHRLAAASGSNEFYYALPTTATSNQMFTRIERFIKGQLNLGVKVKLVHSQALLVEDDLRLKPLTNGQVGYSQPVLEWFGPKKRALLAPFGVGTIDQAELGALNVKHVALRLAGLAGKVLILDEVHAYDTYMTAIIERLLRWLSVLGTSVILLSATLPAARRAALARAYGITFDESPAYPNLWIGGKAGVYQSSPQAVQRERKIRIDTLTFAETDILAKAGWLLGSVKDGGCACWITNTVQRAQALYQAVRQAAPELDVILIHSRFSVHDRQRIEQELIQKYGPDGLRPERGIVIGTQVLEQSLDLDFDGMVTDLAPVDLLLQRAGRLQRHAGRVRPLSFDILHLCICIELDENNEPILIKDRAIYDEYILRKSWKVLKAHGDLSLPNDYRLLIEAVYGASQPQEADPLRHCWQELQKKETNARGEANNRLVAAPHPRDPFCDSAAIVFEEDDEGTAWFVAQTRLGEKSLNILPLKGTGQTAECVGLDNPIPLNLPAQRDLQLALLRRSIKISGNDIVEAVQASVGVLPRLFSDSALLKGLKPLWLADGQAVLANGKNTLTFKLDPELGMVIFRSKGGVSV